jgi:hypothetical protein
MSIGWLAVQFTFGLSLWCRLSPSGYESCLWHVRVMQGFNPKWPDRVEIMIPRYVCNRIAMPRDSTYES